MPRTKFEAMLDARCPRCREGKLFTHPWYKIAKFDKMYEHCPQCGLRYETEPGLFYGAMFISYGFTVAIMVALGVFIYVAFNDPDNLWLYYVLPVTIVSLIFVPFNFRISRVLMLHLFAGIRYDESLSKSGPAAG